MYYFVLKCVCIFSDDCQEYFTSPLQLSNQEWHFHNLIPSVDGMIPLEGICHLKVTGNIHCVPGVSGLGQKYAFTKKSTILTGSLRNFVKMRSS